MPDADRIRRILTSNVGFTDPARWMAYASRHGFREVRATQIAECPGCGGPIGRVIGQYVYYSTLIHLIECRRCGLIWADARLDECVIQEHFEHAYKDNGYFAVKRAAIFAQLADIASASSPPDASVLDIGGATGALLAALATRRPDLNFTLNDLSEDACRAAAAKFRVATRCGDVGSLASQGTTYDTVICSDVLYYEPDLQRLWQCLPRLVRGGGTLIIRVPNKAWLIHAAAMVRGVIPKRFRRRQDRISFFNPEHLYILRRRYLERQLRTNGFHSVVAIPSRMLLRSRRLSFVESALFRVAASGYVASGGLILATPSLLITAVRDA